MIWIDKILRGYNKFYNITSNLCPHDDDVS